MYLIFDILLGNIYTLFQFVKGSDKKKGDFYFYLLLILFILLLLFLGFNTPLLVASPHSVIFASGLLVNRVKSSVIPRCLRRG